jgi:hypothetical protein
MQRAKASRRLIIEAKVDIMALIFLPRKVRLRRDQV